MYVNTNITALFAENAYSNTLAKVNQLSNEMSTGLQINSPADNPAGLAIANIMQGELNGLTQASANVSQATNLVQTAVGGVNNDMQILQQLQSLATQAAQNTNSSSQLQAIQQEINSLVNVVNQSAQTTNYNNLKVLSGDYGASVTNGTGVGTGATISAVYLGADSGSAFTQNVKNAQFTVSVQALNTTTGEDQATIQGTMVVNGVTVTIQPTTVTVTTGATSGTVDIQFNNLSGSNGSVSVAPFSMIMTVNQASVSTTATSGTVTIDPPTDKSTLSFQVGPSQSSADIVNANFAAVDANSLGIGNLNVTTSTQAQYAITQVQHAISSLSALQGYTGSLLNQFQYTASNLQSENTNLTQSRATIMDANMPAVSSEFVKEQTLLQSNLAALQSANQLPSLILKLLG
ncbi:flagellin [Sulfobacillus thermosulfidooxidans]|uniref:flagellin N-terminal helical domain-containing protein n=1 Tax=Sulfobacillus thermosulfidooxidans TaxID=28034 RepID=UPI0006B4204E|nr:flagellin [Sulfobacillus thermosulfidooxidans]